MSSIFTPSQAVDVSKEKDWPMHLGMLDWDHTKIVFTKRSLIEFLKYTGVTVDPGFANIAKLPRYAQFGNMATISGSEEMTTTEGVSSPELAIQAPASDASGAQRLLGEEFPDDALATAPPASSTDNSDNTAEQSSDFKPTRRVRTIPGGTSTVGNLFSEENATQFIPTRRVRQRPGGQDSIEGLF